MRVWLAIAALGLVGCNTPTIPIPPPQVEDVTFALDAPGMTATFEYTGGEPYALAYVYLYNLTLDAGAAATRFDDTGHVLTAPFPARLDDEIDIAFRRDGELSTLCVLLRPPPLGDQDLCPGP